LPEPFEILSPSLQPRANASGQVIGKALPDFIPRPPLPETDMTGHYARLEAFDTDKHAIDLFTAYSANDGDMWTYMPVEPFHDAATMARHIRDGIADKGFQTFAIIDSATGKALGQASYMRQDPANGSVEVGWVAFSPALQRSRIATDAMYLMMVRAFAHGYRRYEWKCDQLNIPSNRAALRLGFQFEGVFRNAMVIKGRRRDTAWYSLIAEDWPQAKARLETWLDPANFDGAGQQITPLRALPL
jgi:RimJ/RimL family protein N-acetyltransferase